MADRNLVTKPDFLIALSALESKRVKQVMDKIQMLLADPLPDGKVRKKLKGQDGVYRLRSGDYRIFYTFDEGWVSVLTLRKRDESTYADDVEPEHLGEQVDVPAVELAAAPTVAHWVDQGPVKVTSRALPRPIDAALLDALRVPAGYRAPLMAVTDGDALLECEAVPDEVRLKLYDALFERPLEQIKDQPDLLVRRPDDLLRYREGELLGFLLRLDPQQEKFVSWGRHAAGPTLLKGGPGTGKSTVALYRAQFMLRQLRADGVQAPRILFTTYTNALTRVSEQLLADLLGSDAGCVAVRTADSVARGLLGDALAGRPATLGEVKARVDEAIERAPLPGNRMQQLAGRAALQRLGADYLTDEVLGVIQARGMLSVDDYLSAARPGRRVPLNAARRRAVWALAEWVAAALRRRGRYTWQGMRAQAAAIAEQPGQPRYDGVIVDECQDLDPVALRMLVALCAAPNRLFLTADANQSVYGGGFRWSDVHASLRFVGRTGILRSNHRSTREIGEAAWGWLTDGALDEIPPTDYAHRGPLPAVRVGRTMADGAALVERFVRAAAAELHLPRSSAAVLVPDKRAGATMAERLAGLGLPARYMASREMDLTTGGVTVTTLQAAKGLEFPIVAIAGFGRDWPRLPEAADDEVRAEAAQLYRRQVFVGLTRAMRALLVVEPRGGESMLSGFETPLWNTGEPA